MSMLRSLPPEAVKFIVIHCSATSPALDVGAEEISEWHRARGFLRIGYHFVVRRDGSIERGRPLNTQGAHASGFNDKSIGICWVGGVDTKGAVQDNRTPAQRLALARLVAAMARQFPDAEVVGHRDLTPDRNRDGVVSPNEWLKGCPSFDVRKWWAGAKP